MATLASVPPRLTIPRQVQPSILLPDRVHEKQRKPLSHWSRYEAPSLNLVARNDAVDHWAKLRKKRVEFAAVQSVYPRDHYNQRSMRLPTPAHGIQQHYHEQGLNREDLLKRSYAMYYQGRSSEGGPGSVHAKERLRRQPSVYHKRAKEGFKFWIDQDPNIKKISFCSKYTFGSKHTFHGLGNAPRN